MLEWLPKGSSLPPEAWGQRHRAIRLIIWLHVVGIPLFATARGESMAHGLVEAVPVAAFGLLAGWSSRSRKLQAGAAALALLTCSGILVHLSGGAIEMHFHFFVMIGVLTMYQDWLPFLIAIGYVVFHHGLFGMIAPEDVYNHAAGINSPTQWALIHAAFVLAASAAYLVAWRMSESSRTMLTQVERQMQEQRRKVLDRTIEATEEERKRLSAELHDGPVQHLAALDFHLQTAMHSMRRSDSARSEQLMAEVQKRLRSEVAGLRRMMVELRPPVLDERGLAAALSDHLEALRREADLDSTFRSSLDDRIDPEVETALYRVAQEALTNVVKHAGTREADVSLSRSNGSIVLEVLDRGVGFDPSEPVDVAAHYGMLGMRERVELAGGTWNVESTPGVGTRIQASIPKERAR